MRSGVQQVPQGREAQPRGPAVGCAHASARDTEGGDPVRVPPIPASPRAASPSTTAPDPTATSPATITSTPASPTATTTAANQLV